MKQSIFIRTSIAAGALGMLAACGGDVADTSEDAAAASSDEPAVIAERQSNFEGIGDAFKVIRGQLEGGAPDFAAIGTAATDINERAQKIPDHFPADTGVDNGYDTEALATIWEKPAEFEEAAQNLSAASAELITVAAGGDAAAVVEQVKAMGGTCKACHDDFRLDTD